MPQRQPFGRRITPQPQPAVPVRAEPAALRVVAPAVVEQPSPFPVEEPAPSSVDQEVQAWKAARGSKFKIPWRQVYLMASLCFGVASFVLPDSMNDNVDYLLWGLCAMSAYAWYTGRKKKSVTDSAAP
jgi:hypothetical protein